MLSRPPTSPLFPYTTLFRSLRGDPLLARFAFDNAIRSARGVGDAEALAPALVGLAQVVVLDEPDRARELSDESVTLGRDVDRKSTRLNSSHMSISYAVCCLK